MRFLKLKEVIQMTGISKTTIYRLMETSSFPAQYQITENMVRWKEGDISEWMQQKTKKAG